MKLISTLLLIFLSANLVAQKPAKGSSAGNPWTEDVSPIRFPTNYHNDTARSSGFSFFNEDLSFGKWAMRVTGPIFFKRNETKKKEDLKFLPFILGAPADVVHLQSLVNNIYLKGKDPDGNTFSGEFFFLDSMIENYSEKGFLAKMEDYHYMILQKIADGYVKTSLNDSMHFKVSLDFQNPANPLNQQSYLLTNTSSIFVQPAFNTDTTKKDPERGLFSGFQFIREGKVIGEAMIKKGFLGSPVYKYWCNAELDTSTKQTVAAVLRVIVSFF